MTSREQHNARNTHRFRFTPGAMVVSALVLFTVAGCSHRQALPGETTYSRDARFAYEEAAENLDDGYYQEALDGFRRVMNRYPQSKYAILAELKIADTHFERGAYVEAADAYRSFAQRRPGSDQVPYALYRVGLAYYEDRPEDWLIFPPAYEYDQTPTQNAIGAFREYLRRFPEHTLAEDARAKVLECRTLLADHELYVARFYSFHDHFGAAAARYERIREKFYDLSLAPQALFELADVYADLGDAKREQDALVELSNRYADAPQAGKARKRLGPGAPPLEEKPPLETPATATDATAPAPAAPPAPEFVLPENETPPPAPKPVAPVEDDDDRIPRRPMEDMR